MALASGDATGTMSNDGVLSLKPVPVTFVAPGASQVQIAGSFNGWARPIMLEPREDQDGEFTSELYLYPGTHEVKYILNGDQWVIDENAPTNGDGMERNNIIEVE